jgi:hypothetical protein
MGRVRDKLWFRFVLFCGICPAIFVGALAYFIEAPGLVIHPDFKEGIALCEQGMDIYPYEIGDKTAIAWQKNDVSYLVNWGHEKDEGLQKLVELAQKHCKQYAR